MMNQERILQLFQTDLKEYEGTVEYKVASTKVTLRRVSDGAKAWREISFTDLMEWRSNLAQLYIDTFLFLAKEMSGF
jgi:hypothetical protein